MTTRVYIDGFNLYYGALKNRPYRWLNLERLADEFAGPTRTVDRVIYCTAKIKARPDDPDAGKYQAVYLRALHALPRVDIALGKFSVKDVDARRRPRDTCACCQSNLPGCSCCAEPLVPIIKTEEKGTDVNLAVRLVEDGYEGRFDDAFIVSDDSDLQGAVDIVTKHLKKKVYVVSPRNRTYHPIVGSGYRDVRPTLLGRCLLPTTVTLADGGVVHKPRHW